MDEMSSLGFVSIAPGAIRTRDRLACLILLIPSWESPRADREEKQGPQVTSNIGKVEGLKALELKPPIREER
jgi:hypothetical protein